MILNIKCVQSKRAVNLLFYAILSNVGDTASSLIASIGITPSIAVERTGLPSQYPQSIYGYGGSGSPANLLSSTAFCMADLT